MRTTVRDVLSKAGEEPITVLTAYDAVTAELVDEQGVDVILVGDSVGNTQHGPETTLPVTVDQMADHTAAVAGGADDAVGLSDWTPSFVEEFGDVRAAMRDAVGAYADAVASGEFPRAEHSECVEDLDELY